MSDYHVIAVDGSQSYGTFDRYRPAREHHAKLSKTKTVNLICMHTCGCTYRALVKFDRHVGWRRAEACSRHKRAAPFEKYGLDDAAIEAERKRKGETKR